jgi:hypothetical protein
VRTENGKFLSGCEIREMREAAQSAYDDSVRFRNFLKSDPRLVEIATPKRLKKALKNQSNLKDFRMEISKLML